LIDTRSRRASVAPGARGLLLDPLLLIGGEARPFPLQADRTTDRVKHKGEENQRDGDRGEGAVAGHMLSSESDEP